MSNEEETKYENGTQLEGFNKAATEEQWSIRLCAVPIKSHGAWHERLINPLLSLTNHDYLEIMDPDKNIIRRLHAREPDMGMKGRTMGSAHGSEEQPFTEDQILLDDPHPTIPNMLPKGDSEAHASVIFRGTEEQVLTMYHQMLECIIDLNNRELEYDGLKHNGNTFTHELMEKMQQTAAAYGLHVKNFNPRGIDIAFKDQYETAEAGKVNFESIDELKHAIKTLEGLVADQVDDIMENKYVDLETEIPEWARLEKPSGRPEEEPTEKENNLIITTKLGFNS